MTKTISTTPTTRKMRRAPWSGRIARPVVRPSNFTHAQARKAVRDYLRAQEQEAKAATHSGG